VRTSLRATSVAVLLLAARLPAAQTAPAATSAAALPAAASHAPPPPAPSGASPAPRPSAAELRADLAQLRALVDTLDRSWTDATRAIARTRIDALLGAVDTISPLAFELGVARVVAAADNGHSAVIPDMRAPRTNSVGLRFVPLDSGFYVLRAAAAEAPLVGARLLAVDGVAVARLRAAAHTLVPGTPAWRDRSVPLLLESPEQMHALALAGAPDAATYRLRLLDGRVVERRLVAHAAGTRRPTGPSRRWLLAAPASGWQAGWHAPRAADALPWALRDPDVPFRWVERPELQALVVDIRHVMNLPGRSLTAFLDSVRVEIARRAPYNIVVDLRLNGGGDLGLARAFMQDLPRLVPGTVFVLTSPWTFSAAISSAGYAKQADPARVRIVGDTVGDRLVFFAEGHHVTLAHSGITIGLATERHDYVDGCRTYRDCHAAVVEFPIAVPTLAPDLFAPWTMAAYRAGCDPAMEAIARWLARAEAGACPGSRRAPATGTRDRHPPTGRIAALSRADET
jgi:hypothetical protein